MAKKVKRAPKRTSKEVMALAENSVEKLAEAIQNGASDHLTEYLTFYSKFHRYSFHNTCLIWSQKPTATHVAGYQTWKKAGRYVNKGETGIAILVPHKYQKVVVETDVDGDETKTTRSGVRFGVGYVYDISQTEGESVPEFFVPLSATQETDNLLKKTTEAIESEGITIEYTNNGNGIQGTSSGGKITLEPDRDSHSTLLTLVHEWAHEKLHHGDNRANFTRHDKEAQAEATAYVVAEQVGIGNPYSVDYIISHCGDTETLAAHLTAITKCAGEILEKISD